MYYDEKTKTYYIMESVVASASKCNKCKHKIDLEDGRFCKAFPDVNNIIPDEFLTAYKTHDKVIPSQVGDYVFEEETD